MALGPRLEIRQSQSLVMTPRLQQAIKLLALSNLELETHIAEALEANPLLEVGEVSREAGEEIALPGERESAPLMDSAGGEEAPLDVEASALDPEAAPGDADWGRAADSGGFDSELPDFENRQGEGPTLAEHLLDQIGAAARDTREALVAARLVGEIDEAGYFIGDIPALAGELAAPRAEVERGLALIQSLDPTGVGARGLAECLAL